MCQLLFWMNQIKIIITKRKNWSMVFHDLAFSFEGFSSFTHVLKYPMLPQHMTRIQWITTATSQQHKKTSQRLYTTFLLRAFEIDTSYIINTFLCSTKIFFLIIDLRLWAEKKFLLLPGLHSYRQLPDDDAGSPHLDLNHEPPPVSHCQKELQQIWCYNIMA